MNNKYFSLLIICITAFSCICCGPSAEQKAKQEAEIQAHIEALAKHKADSIACVEAEKKRIEEKRQEEERKRQEEIRRLEEEKNTWTGATSLEELKSKIIGKTWTCTNTGTRYEGLMYKFEFSNGTIKRYSTMKRNGCWNNPPITYNYSVTVKRDSNGENYVCVSFGDDSDLDHARQYIAFMNQCTIVVWGYYGASRTPIILEFGDYQWSNNL